MMFEGIAVSELLRPGLLEGISVLVAGAAPGEQASRFPGVEVSLVCSELGARVAGCDAIAGESSAAVEAAVGAAVERALSELDELGMLVVDGAALLAAPAPARDARERSRAALRGCLEAAWNVTRAVANLTFLDAGRGGRIVYLAPAPDAGEHAGAALAGLENLARTLSVEWARHDITVVTIAPGAATSPGELAALSAYLASPAGAYFSGCLLDLRGAGAHGEAGD
jgi:NAD(P)-dependent dehydrogenase (short-subunit alcohol dehydrogenase family)